MVIRINDFPMEKFILLKCSGFKEIIPLQKGLDEDWRICFECGAIFCSKCLIDLSLYSESICPGSRVTFSHKINPSQIPKNEILSYAYKVRHDIFQDPIYQLFYTYSKDDFSPSSRFLDFDPFLGKNDLSKIENFWRKEKCIFVRFPKSAIFDLTSLEEIQLRQIDINKINSVDDSNLNNFDSEDNNQYNEVSEDKDNTNFHNKRIDL